MHYLQKGTATPLQKIMIKVNENKATTPVNKNLTKKQILDKLSLESGALNAARNNALDISDRLEGHVEELHDMKAQKGINIPESVIEKVAIMINQVKDLQKKSTKPITTSADLSMSSWVKQSKQKTPTKIQQKRN
jgi:hypothetical protein